MKKISKFHMGFITILFLLLMNCDLGNNNQQQVIEVKDVALTIIDGDFNNQIKIQLSSETSEAEIRYTTDGSTPSENYGTIYTNPFIVDRSAKIKAIAYIGSNGISRVLEEQISLTVGQPQIIPGGHTFNGTLLVSIITATDGAYIRYTTDGTIPSETIGDTYTGPFTITEDTDIRAIAIKDGYSNSIIAFESYTHDDTIPQVGGIIWKGSLSDFPNSPETNWSFYHNIEGRVYIFNGTDWDLLSQDGVDGVDGEDGISIDWRGSYSSAPYSPEENWAYYNSTDGISYIYDGSNWQILAQNGTDGVIGEDGLDGISIIWKGSLDSAPLSPETNWGYYNNSEGISYIYDGSNWSVIAKDGGITEVVAPVMVPGGTTYSTPTAVTLFTTTSGAVIRYTIDGTDPSEVDGEIYSSPILIEYSSTIKAIAYKDGMITSEISGSTYTINRVDNPVFDLTGGEFDSIQTVNISTTTNGATLYITTDGSNPSPMNYEDFGENSISVTVDKSMNLQVIGVKDNYISSEIINEEYVIQNVVVPPGFSLTEDYYTSAQVLSIATETEGAIIYYTTNGTTPSAANYTGSGASIIIDIDASTTVKAIAVKTGWTDSTITSHTFNITGQVAGLTMTPPAGTYTPGTEVYIDTDTPYETIYYTLDGTTPSALNYDGTGYNNVTVTLTDSVIIKAIGVKDYWDDSEIISSDYTITDAVADPVVNIYGGLYNSTQNITITTSTNGASIYYTLDGTEPTPENTVSSGIDSITATISNTSTLRIIATKDGMPSSNIVSIDYTIDTEAPVITLVGNTELYIEQNSTYTDEGATATDNIDGEITDSIISSSSVDTSTIGTYAITYNVSDTAGNSATPVTRTVHVTSSGTMVLPNIEEDTTWTKANSPYNITYNTTVAAGVTLTIDPGVIVKVDDSLALLIDGTIIAEGTEAEPITFTNRGQENWKNIVVSALSSGTALDENYNYISGNIFNYVYLQNGGKNSDRGTLEIYDQNIFIDNSIITNSAKYGLYAIGDLNSSIIIQNSEVSYSMMYPIYLSSHDTIILTNNDLIQNNSYYTYVNCDNISNVSDNNFIDTGLNFQGYHNSTIYNNIFSGFNSSSRTLLETGNGMLCQINNNTFIDNIVKFLLDLADRNNYHHLSNNIIQRNTAHNYLISSDTNYIYGNAHFFMQGNSITNNTVLNNNALINIHGSSDASTTYSQIINNNILNNDSHMIIRVIYNFNNKLRIINNVINNPLASHELYNNQSFESSSIILNLTHNYWGFTDEFTILGRIYDYIDNSDKQKTDYTPFAVDDSIADMVCQPVYSLNTGEYTGTQSVSISTYSPDATIYYTTDGSEPSAVNNDGSGLESVIVEVTATATIKAIAVHSDFNDSEIVEMTYTIQ